MTMTSLALIATTVAADGVRRLARADCAAVHLALQDRENAVAFCPAGDEVAIEYALAAGIPTIHNLEASLPADFQLAYVGTGCAEFVGDICLARWAEKCNASLLFEVLGCSASTEAARCVECDAGRGARHLLNVRGPLLMVLSSHISRPAYVSRYRRQSVARQITLDHSRDQQAIEPQAHSWSPVRPRVRTRRSSDDPAAADDRMNDAFSIQAGNQTESSHVIVADAESGARHLLRYLAHHSFVTRAESDDRLEVAEGHPISAEPSVTGSVSQEVNLASLGAFLERRPRQANDSAARRARQPRPIARA